MGRRYFITLLCLILLSFLLLLLLFVDAGISIYQINNTEPDFSNDTLPGASIIGLTVAALATWGGFLIFGFIIYHPQSVKLFLENFNVYLYILGFLRWLNSKDCLQTQEMKEM